MHTRKIYSAYILSIPTILLSTVLAIAEEAPPAPPAMVEAFFCQYNDGKDRSDLIDARDYFLKQADKGNISARPSFVWHREKGDNPADFIWMTIHENPVAYGNAMDERVGNSDWQAAMQRFNGMSSCTSGVGLISVVVGSEVEFEPPTYIAAHGCNFRKGVSADDLGDLAGRIQSVWGSIDTLKEAPFYSIEPITGSDVPDRVLFTVHDNATAWAEDMRDLVGSDEGQGMFRHMDKLMQCRSAHWLGEQVIPAR